jgi:hypothetical protein
MRQSPNTCGLAVAALMLTACVQRSTTTVHPVPAEPPRLSFAQADSVWKEISRPENVVPAGAGNATPVIRNTLYIWFQDSVPAAEKEAVIHGIRGEVIGGAYLGNRGAYHVRVPVGRDSSIAPLMRLRDELLKRPSVRSITLDWIER